MTNEYYIKRCLQLAKLGFGTTAPNPMVGAVLVYKNQIIGEGYTSPFGGNHAEVNCINSVNGKNSANIKNATLYVSLEPCSHFGKTPPCSNLIVANGIKKVVIGALDSNKLVSGKGVKYLKEHGCEVVENVLANECQKLNKRFFTFHNKKRPYIILKWAVSADGFIGKLTNTKEPIWISNTYSQQLVHLWRSQEQAILVGTNTVIHDNPSLNVRRVKGENPIRIVIDKNLKLTNEYTVLDTKIKTIVFTQNKFKKSQDNLIFEQINFENNVVEQICNVLYNKEIQTVIIEGGSFTLQSFINANLWDEARIFTGTNLLKSGVEAPKINGETILQKNILTDKLTILANDSTI